MDQQTTYDFLNEQLKDIPKAQIRSLSLSVLPRLMGAIHKQKEECPHCQKYNQQGETYINDIKQLFVDDIKTMREFENWVEHSQQHLKSEHQLQVRGRLTASYTIIGIIIGVVLFTVYTWLSSDENYTGFITLGLVAGMLGGYITGKIAENGLQKNNKLY